jgi:hypothetical protein
MDKQTYVPSRPNLAHLLTAEERQVIADKRAQFELLLDEYRNRYVLHKSEPGGKPTR